MENDKEKVQKLFDEVSASTGMPKIDLSEDNSAALPFGEGMLLHVHYRAEIPEVDFTVPIGASPRKRRQLSTSGFSPQTSTGLARTARRFRTRGISTRSSSSSARIPPISLPGAFRQ